MKTFFNFKVKEKKIQNSSFFAKRKLFMPSAFLTHKLNWISIKKRIYMKPIKFDCCFWIFPNLLRSTHINCNLLLFVSLWTNFDIYYDWIKWTRAINIKANKIPAHAKALKTSFTKRIPIEILILLSPLILNIDDLMNQINGNAMKYVIQ